MPSKQSGKIGRSHRTNPRTEASSARGYRFDWTPVLITPPRRLFTGPVLEGALFGGWKVRPTSRSELSVTSMNAALHLPNILAPLGKDGQLVHIGADPILLSKATFALPPQLEREFGRLNTGRFDRHDRYVFTTVGFRAKHELFGATRGVFRTFGYVDQDSFLISGGVAMILSGLLKGTILCCCAPRPTENPQPPADESTPVPAPPQCDGRIVQRDSGATHDASNFTDFQKYQNVDGSFITLATAGPTADDQLGYIQGTYAVPPPNPSEGRFKKIEIEIIADAPCTIVSVNRTMTQLPGHAFGQAHPANAPDQVQPHSIAVRTAQRWVITDGPGMLTNNPVNRTFYKRYTVTATFQRGADTFTRTATYTVLIRTDANGNIIPNPTPP